MAERKVNALLSAGARVTLISPTITPPLESLVRDGTLEYVARPYQTGDLEGAFLAIAATGDRAVNEAVWQEATRRNILINAADDPAHCNVLLPAVIRRGPLTIAISTEGRSPAYAAHLRRQLEDQFGPEQGTFLELLGGLRGDITAQFPALCRKTLWNALIHSDILDLMAAGDHERVDAQVKEILSSCALRDPATDSVAGFALDDPPKRCPLCPTPHDHEEAGDVRGARGMGDSKTVNAE